MTTPANWNLQLIDRYVMTHHDDECEQRERSSLCHCSKRKREREGLTGEAAIHFPPPHCGRCLVDLEFDGDTFGCPTCKLQWSARQHGDGDTSDEYTDDFGDDIGGEQFGRRIRDIVLEKAQP